jgi:hypothetical protein
VVKHVRNREVQPGLSVPTIDGTMHCMWLYAYQHLVSTRRTRQHVAE